MKNELPNRTFRKCFSFKSLETRARRNEQRVIILRGLRKGYLLFVRRLFRRVEFRNELGRTRLKNYSRYVDRGGEVLGTCGTYRRRESAYAFRYVISTPTDSVIRWTGKRARYFGRILSIFDSRT